jgi:hypothetical protein
MIPRHLRCPRPASSKWAPVECRAYTRMTQPHRHLALYIFGLSGGGAPSRTVILANAFA